MTIDQNELGKIIDTNIRLTLGDMTVQLIIAKAQLELLQKAQAAEPEIIPPEAKPKPNGKAHPAPEENPHPIA